MARRKERGRRARLLALVHVGKKQLGMSDDAYRRALRALTGQSSAAALDDNAIQGVVEWMRERGFSPSPPAPSVPRYAMGARPHNFLTNPQYAKIEALLLHCDLAWGYAQSIARRQWKKQLEHCASDELRGVIAALERHKARHFAGGTEAA